MLETSTKYQNEKMKKILGMANLQKENIAASTVNTASILELAELQKKDSTENSASFELIRKKQEEMSLMLATLLKKPVFRQHTMR